MHLASSHLLKTMAPLSPAPTFNVVRGTKQLETDETTPYPRYERMNYLPKKKRGVYEKEFTLQHVLQNLQGYRLASGALDSKVIEERVSKVSEQSKQDTIRMVNDKLGEDLSEVYAQLLTSKPTHSGKSEADDCAHTKKRKRKRKRKKKTLKTHLSTVESRQEDSEIALSNEKAVIIPTLVSYGDSSDSSEVSDDDDDDECSCQRSTGPLPIPNAIQSLYKSQNTATTDKSIEECTEEQSQLDSRPATWDSDSDDALGYFECDDSTSGEEEDRGDKLHPHLVEATEDKLPLSEEESVSEVTKTWSEKKSQWLFGPSRLSSYTCWKCNNVGHLAQDCTVAADHPGTASSKGASGQSPAARIPREVQKCLALCKEMRKKKGQRCADCGVHSNLVGCLDCGSVFCDGRGHLIVHLLQHPSHHKLFSFKLKRLIKCCKATCEVVSVYDLLICSHCLSKAFSQHYSMITALWSRAGLVKIFNAVCCEEHFHWHRMNCSAVEEEKLVTETKLQSTLTASRKLSEFFF